MRYTVNKNGGRLAYHKVSGTTPNVLYIPGFNIQYIEMVSIIVFLFQDLCLGRMGRRRST